MNKEKARKWAVEIVEELKDAGRMPKDANLESFTDKSQESTSNNDYKSNIQGETRE